MIVLHGAGRQDELLVRACADEPERRNALFVVLRSGTDPRPPSREAPPASAPLAVAAPPAAPEPVPPAESAWATLIPGRVESNGPM